jgi:hypothetical protein
MDRRVRNADPELRLQPWFNHWAWCVTAEDLTAHIQTQKLRRNGPDVLIPADDAYLGAIRGAQRLCHLFEEVRTDFVRGLPFADGPEAERSDRDRDRDTTIDLNDWTSPLPREGGRTFEIDDEDEHRVQLWY